MKIRFQADADLNQIILLASTRRLVIIPQHLPVASAVEDILLIWSMTEKDEWTNRIGYLPL